MRFKAKSLQKGISISDYTLITPLGKGGNGIVWKVRNRKGEIFALKELKTATFYNLERFKNEIKALSELNGKSGVMPILDHDLESDIKWYLMPISTPSKDFLISKNYIGRIDFYFQISQVLADLHDQSIFHRDIKPENLFGLNGVATLGDFGLVKLPNSVNLTEKGKKLGPSFYIAPEMLDSPEQSDPSKADVYSLAKSLWVTLTDQNFPIPGEHTLSYKPILLSTYINDDRLIMIDRVLELCTKLNPHDRLTMKEFSTELQSWLYPDESNTQDFLSSEVLKKLGVFASIEKNEHDEWDRYHNEGNVAFQTCYDLLTPFFNSLKTQFNGLGSIGGFNDVVAAIRTTRSVQYDGQIKTVSGGGFSFRIEKPTELNFWCGLGMEIFKNGEINFGAAYVINNTGFPEVIWQHSEIVKIGTPKMEKLIVDLSNNLPANFKVAMTKIEERLS